MPYLDWAAGFPHFVAPFCAGGEGPQIQPWSTAAMLMIGSLVLRGVDRSGRSLSDQEAASGYKSVSAEKCDMLVRPEENGVENHTFCPSSRVAARREHPRTRTPERK